MCDQPIAKPHVEILQVLAGLAAHHGKMWCFPSQETILELLRKHYSLSMCRRSLNDHLKTWESRGYITRIRRHKKSANGALLLHSTLYTIQSRCVAMLGKMSRFFALASQHHWAKKWISAVQVAAQSVNYQTNIIPEPPKKQASFGVTHDLAGFAGWKDKLTL